MCTIAVVILTDDERSNLLDLTKNGSAAACMIGRAPILLHAADAIATALRVGRATSGLVIQCLARFQEIFSCVSAVRMVSSLTRRGVMPWANATSAARASVQMLVCLPKARGL